MKVKLVKGLSYTTPSFSCMKGKEIEVTDEVGSKLMKTGRFEHVVELDDDQTPDGNGQTPDGNGSTGSDNNGNGTELTATVIEKMKKDELIALAEAKGIDISDCSNNDERAGKIKGALGLVNLTNLFGE